MSERYLGRTQEPSIAELNMLSLRKYKKMIDARGGWNLFQELLPTLKRIAQKYNISIANVATRYIIDKSAVAAVIIGVRLGIVNHRNSNMQVFNFSLGRFQYMNMRILNSPQMQETCRYLSAMGNDFLQVIPDVWTTLVNRNYY